jgi:hypothetical protein
VIDVLYYVKKAGRDVVDKWITGLGDDRTEARILAGLKDLRVEILAIASLWEEAYLSYASMLGRAIESITR